MSNYRIVSRAYPTEYWDEHGGEILATANELNDDRWSFRESRQLASNGLRTRSFEATGGQLRHIWTQGLAIFLFITLLQGTSAWVSSVVGLFDELVVTGPSWMFAGLSVALFALSVSTRWPLMLFVVTTLVAPMVADGVDRLSLVVLSLMAVLIAAFGNGQRVIPPTATAAVFIASAATTSYSFFGPGLLTPALFVVGLIAVRLDQRLLAAAASYAAFVAIRLTADVFSNENETVLGLPIALVIGIGAVLIAGALAALVTFSARRSAIT